VAKGDFDVIGLPTDFLGLNIYSGTFVRAGRKGKPERLAFPVGYPATTFSGWLRTVPQAIYWGTRLAQEVYGAKAIYITENGYGAIEEPDANGEILDHNRSPARKVGELDNRGSHFYLALYWAQALAARDNSSGLAARFKPLADLLSANEKKIYGELIEAQGKAQELGGYYRPDDAKTSAAMRPSKTLNEALATLKA